MEIAYTDALKGLSDNICPRGSVTPPFRQETRNWEMIAAMPRFRDPSVLEVVREQLRQLSGRRHIFFAPSGRCAIAQVLSVMPQQEVVMPAWTCPVVKEAAELAGKRVIFVDIAQNSVNAASEQYERVARPGRILLPTHFFGVPTDVVQICNLAKDRDCATLEDAAPAFPGRLGGRLLGTFGDVGILSFERSKRVPSFRGAAIIVNNEDAIDVDRLASYRVVPTKSKMPVREIVFCALYNFATNPWLFGRITLPRKLRMYMAKSRRESVASVTEVMASPQCTASDDVWYSRDIHPYQATLVAGRLAHIGAIREHIEKLASIYLAAFRDTVIQTFLPPGCDTAGLLRFPIAFTGIERAEVLRAALRRGIFPDASFEQLVPSPKDNGAFPNSLWAAQNLILLPLNTKLSLENARDLATRIAEMAREICPPERASVVHGLAQRTEPPAPREGNTPMKTGGRKKPSDYGTVGA